MKTWTVACLLTLCIIAVSAHSKIRQKRAWIIDSFAIDEESPGPFPYSLGVVHVEKKYLLNFRLIGSGVDEDPKGVLKIDTKTGEVCVHKKVDYEEFQVLKLKFEALNVSNSEVDTRLGLEIRVRDVNDHPPVFKPLNYEMKLGESERQGKSIMTVSASDGDDPSTRNGTFDFRLVSVTPNTDNVEFYIKQDNTTGNIYFKGCLDDEKAHKYTLLIEAKDKGDKVQLSSTSTVVLNIIDQNNHLPEITGHTGPGKITERESGVEVLRLNVRDKDSPGSPAWKAKFTLHGAEKNYFKIQTDPETNQGILTVVKAMDYEEHTSVNVSISVENEEPYFYCKVKNRPSQGLWDIETSDEGSSMDAPQFPKLYPVTIAVENINDPPEFVPPVQSVMIMENKKVGTPLYTLTAIDQDKSSGDSLHFVKGEDKDDWVTVDPKTGQVSVAKIMDRESEFVNTSTYSVIMYVVDDAQPPATGTGTLVISLGDQNDNVPLLEVNKLDMCLSDKETRTNITAVDLDLPPYSAPFHYELLGDVKGKWKIEPKHGTTVNLIREKNVYSGHYEFQVKISDSQGSGSVQNLSITVCDCIVTPNCHGPRYLTAQPSLGAIGIIILALLLLLAFLLMAFLMSCKQKKIMIPNDDDVPDWYLIKSNTETPGTDCKLPAKITQLDMSEHSVKTFNYLQAQNRIYSQESMLHNGFYQGFGASPEQQMIKRSLRWGTASTKHATYSPDTFFLKQELLNQLNQRLIQLQTQEDLLDYEPHCYADEGEHDTNQNLDPISIPEMDFNPDIITNVDFQFKKLATLCRPDLSQFE